MNRAYRFLLLSLFVLAGCSSGWKVPGEPKEDQPDVDAALHTGRTTFGDRQHQPRCPGEITRDTLPDGRIVVTCCRTDTLAAPVDSLPPEPPDSTEPPPPEPPDSTEPPPPEPPDSTEPPPPEPPDTTPPPEPPPPPSGDCEAASGSRCWWVDAAAAAGGNGTEGNPFRTPQIAAADSAGPGDFIYLAGTFTTDHRMTTGAFGGCDIPEARGCTLMGGTHNSGTAAAPITMKPWPGRTALVQGNEASQTNLIVGIGGSYWRIEDLTIVNGYLIVAWRFVPGVHDIEIVRADVSRGISPPGNTGLIRLHEGNPSPANVTVRDSRAHELLACQGGVSGPCTGPTVESWINVIQQENHSCFMVQDASGPVIATGNTFERCTAILYLKRGGGSYEITGNVFRDAFWMGVCRHSNGVIEGNVIENVGSLVRAGTECVTR